MFNPSLTVPAHLLTRNARCYEVKRLEYSALPFRSVLDWIANKIYGEI